MQSKLQCIYDVVHYTSLSFLYFCSSSPFLFFDPITTSHPASSATWFTWRPRPSLSVTSAPSPCSYRAPGGGLGRGRWGERRCLAAVQRHPQQTQLQVCLWCREYNRNHVPFELLQKWQTRPWWRNHFNCFCFCFFSSDADSAYLYFRWCS